MMLKTLREEFLEKKSQILIVANDNTIVASDNVLFTLKEGTDITEFHPFFFILSGLFESSKNTQNFFCVQIEVLGKVFFLDISSKVDRAKEQVYLCIEDLTDHYKNVHQIKQVRNESIIQFNITQELNNELEVQRGFKNKFLADVSHEIRTPLNSILGFLNVLRNTDISREQLDVINIVSDSSNTLVSILDDLLDISKIEAGRLEIKNRRFDFKEYAAALVKTYALRAEEKRLNFIADIGDNIPRFLVGDRLRLNQILVNLLENALKYTHQGSIHFTIGTSSRNMRRVPITFEVKDTGIGIPEEYINSIFDSFTQLEKRGLFGGSGLGLSIVKQLTNLMESDLEVKSKEGEGSSFKFTITLGVSHDQKAKRQEIVHTSSGKKVKAGSKKYRVLLGEDIEVNQLLMMKLFADQGQYSLDIAKNGERVIEFLEKYPYDLVLMDLTMPVMDGLDAALRIRGHSNNKIQKIPIIALTARVAEEQMEAAKEAGMNSYLTKPVDQEVLFKTIDKLIHRYKRKPNEIEV